MKAVVAVVLALTAASTSAQPLTQRFPSCDLRAQHALKGEVGGTIRNRRQAHVSMRANILQADLGNASKAGRLTQATAMRLFKRVEAIRNSANRRTDQKGFLSAAVVRTYDRDLDAVATRMCHR